MADSRLPLLRGRINAVDTYEAPQRGGARPALPSLDPKAHRSKLLQQLDTLSQAVRSRAEAARDPSASRELIAVRPAPDAKLAAEQLDDKKSDARLVGEVPDTGTVVLDVASAELEYLRKKVDAFGDDSKVEVKVGRDGSVTTRRDKERAVAPVESIGLATLEDIQGARLRAESVVPDRPYWFEVACRGGYRCPPTDTEASRAQISRQLHRLGASQPIDEFLAPEKVYFFLRLTQSQLRALHAATDCVYEVELAPEPLRDLKLLDELTTGELKTFTLIPPEPKAPSVVLLDTGIATNHPLLSPALLAATSVTPEIPSPEDTYGHGTKMAGIALYRDRLASDIQHGTAVATHWIQSSRLLVAPKLGLASDENYDKWPVLTAKAVRAAEDADSQTRDRVFVLAVTRSMQDPPLSGLVPTLWSHAVDQIAYHDGSGRLLVVSAGNARDEQWLALAEQHPALQLSEKIHQPAQAPNALTVGAFTERVELPNLPDYLEHRVVASKPGGISPYTSTGLVGSEWSIKPDIVLEGGNLAISGGLPATNVPGLCALTTHHHHTHGQPLGPIAMTSEATARAGYLAARVWTVEPRLKPQTVRALIVHSASWTKTMMEQFPGMNDRLLACGYGVPDERVASECAQGIATIVVEDIMPTGVLEEEPKKAPPKRPTTKATERKLRRRVKLFRLPLDHTLLDHTDPDVELRVTLSYFAEPNKFGRRTLHGLDLKWDMQGPQESEDEFLQRINVLRRPKAADGKRAKVVTKKSFDWDVGIQMRSRGTLQSDRWRGNLSQLVGDKLIAIVPVLGWWDQRPALQTQEMPFSLVVSVFGPGVYAAIKPRIEAAAAIPIEM